jgi:putative hydrolase of the HAD superfamily
MKPEKEYFDHVLDKLGIEASQALMVGDSNRTDIVGATAAGIATCKLDRLGSTYVIEFCRLHRGRRVAEAVRLAWGAFA